MTGRDEGEMKTSIGTALPSDGSPVKSTQNSCIPEDSFSDKNVCSKLTIASRIGKRGRGCNIV